MHKNNLLESLNYVEMYEIDEEIKKNKEFIDAVVISGGEPFMQPQAVAGIAKYAKTHSLFVAVQTNGFYPEVIESMLRRNLVDKIFLDIKAPLSDGKQYDRIAENLEDAGVASCRYVIQQGRVVHLNDVQIQIRDGGEEEMYRRSNSW